MNDNITVTANPMPVKFPVAAVFFFITAALNLVPIIEYHGSVYGGYLEIFSRLQYIPRNFTALLLPLTVGVLLLMKRRDKLLVIALAVWSCLILYNGSGALHHYYGIMLVLHVTVFSMLPFAALTILAALNLGDKDEGQLGSIKYLWLVPGVLVILNFVLKITWGIPPEDFISAPLSLLALFFAGHWLVFPYAKANPIGRDGTEAGEGYIDMAKHVILLFLTCGIWMLIWVHRTTRYCNHVKNGAFHNPTTKLLLFMFIPFYGIYWYAKQGQRLDAIAQEHGDRADFAVLYLLLGIFFPFVAIILMQDRINKIAQNAYGAPAQPVQNNNDASFEKLRQLKSLLDAGIITEDEFAAKKKQLLGL